MKKHFILFTALFYSIVLSSQIQWSDVNFISRNSAEVGVADVDQDGNVDILIGGGQQRWYAGPDFEEWHLIGMSDGGPYAARVADMNGDGWDDFVTSDGARNEGDIPGHIYLYLNPGATGPVTEEWTRIVVYEGNVRHQNDMRIADMDGDGLLDIIERTWSQERVVVAMQNPDITDWTVRPFDTGETGKPEGISTGDLDGDGEMEIVLSGVYWDNPGGWRTGDPVQYGVDPEFVQEEVKSEVGDIDNDGDNDIYMGSAEGGAIYIAWYENTGVNPDGSVALTKHIIKDNWGKCHMIELVDIDQDGDLNVCTGKSFGENGLLIYYNQNNGENWTEQDFDPGGEIYTGQVEDLDGDGDLDYIGPSRFNNGLVRYYFNETPVGPPSAPENLVATLDSGLDISLAWDDLSDNETSFEIERNEAGNWMPLEVLNANTLGYLDSSTLPSTLYSYRVRATNIAGVSDWILSNEVETFEQAGAISISPSGGVYLVPPTIELQAAVPFESIYFTTNGTIPSAQNGTEYTGPFVLNESATINALAVGQNLIPSSISTEEYSIAVDGNFAPVANAGADAEGEINTQIYLDATASTDLDDDFSALNFVWNQTFGPAVDIVQSNEAVANFTTSTPGIYTFEVVVSDEIASDAASVSFEIIDPDAIIGPAPIAYWPMDDGAGAIAVEEIASKDASLNLGVSWSEDGIDSGAAVFNGTDGRMTATVVDIASDEMSISFWMNPSDIDEVEARMVSKASGTVEAQHFWMVSQISGSGLRFRLNTEGDGTTTLASSTGQIAPDNWYFVVATYDGVQMRLYNNTDLIANTAKTGMVGQSGAVPVAIGNQPVGAGERPFAGKIDEVKIYDQALTPEEIQAIYDAALSPPAVCLGDLNLDGMVNTTDLLTMVGKLGTPCQTCIEDLDNNMVVNTSDLLFLISVIGTTCD